MITNRTYGMDNDVIAYNARIIAGGNQGLSVQSLRQLNQFVISIKKMNLWYNIVCWPLRANQNAGTGVIAYSLGGFGTYNGTLVNSPIWQINGINMVNTPVPSITTSAFVNQPNSIFTVQRFDSSVTSAQVVYDGTQRQHLYKNADNGFINGFAGNNSLIIPSASINNRFSSFQLKFNGAAGTASIDGSTESTINFGTNNLTAFSMGGAQQGVILSFAMIVNKNINMSFHSLYKSTLGQDLGLT